MMPIVGKYYQQAGSSFRQDVCEACFGHLSEAEQLEYEEAMPSRPRENGHGMRSASWIVTGASW